MAKAPSIVLGQEYTERTLIENLVASFYIVDYGYVAEVNADGTVNVVHAKLQADLEGNTFKEIKTKNIEVLALSTNAFSIKWDIKPGDKMLLLGLKDYVREVADVSKATDQEAFIHYRRETLKALPLCVFNDDAKIQIKIDGADFSMKTSGNVTLKCKKLTVEGPAGPALEVAP